MNGLESKQLEDYINSSLKMIWKKEKKTRWLLPYKDHSIVVVDAATAADDDDNNSYNDDDDLTMATLLLLL